MANIKISRETSYRETASSDKPSSGRKVSSGSGTGCMIAAIGLLAAFGSIMAGFVFLFIH